jgi:hypothetical protein
MEITSKLLQQFIDALLLCGSPFQRDWDEAQRRLGAIHPFHVFRGDLELIGSLRGGSEAARRELGRRGTMLASLMVFSQPYDKRKWDDARRTLLAIGEGGAERMADTLLMILLNGQYQESWVHARFALVESGEPALLATVEVMREKARQTTTTPVFKMDDQVQLLIVVIGFGDRGRPYLEEFAKHPSPNVRRAVARAIGEAVDAGSAPVLLRMVAEDADWSVRMTAAQSCAKLSPARDLVGPALVDRIRKERDRAVLKVVLESVGEVHYEPAVPDLVRSLEVPSLELAEKAMYALYRISGEKFTRREEWYRWYREKYPAWKDRPREAR